MDAHERARGLVGMLKWCHRVAARVSKWGFLPDGGRIFPAKVHVKLLFFKEKRWQVLMEMKMSVGNDGFIHVEGKFPITII